MREETAIMFIDETNDEDISTNTEAYYQTLASQEEIYLEGTEGKLRMILESDDPSLTGGESVDHALEDAAKELITGDPDDLRLAKRR